METIMHNNKELPATIFLENVEKIRRQRVLEHQSRILASKTKLGAAYNIVSNRSLNLLADGDSWFDYLGDDVIAQLPKLDNRANFHPPLNLSVAGDRTSNSLGVSRQKRIIEALSNNENGKFDAILFSGGGDDIVGEQFCLWLNNANDVGHDYNKALKEDALNNMLSLIENAYKDLIKLRNSHAPDIPIFVHSYDFPPPNNSSVCKLAGPWLHPSLSYRGWNDFQSNAALVKSILLKFNKILKDISDDKNNNTILVETQNTLHFTDEKDSKDWANELHPTRSGFEQISRKFLKALKDRFPGRIPA